MDNNYKSRHERRRNRTIAQLRQAAMELLLEKGYDAISIQDITDRADLGRGTFYIYFRNKEEIVWNIIEEGIKRTTEEAILNAAGEMPEQPEYFSYVNIFRHAQQNRDLYRIMIGGQGSSLLTKRIQDYLTADFIHDHRKYGIYDSGNAPPEIFAQILTGALFRLLIWWLETPNDYSPEQMAEILQTALHKQRQEDNAT
jgi:AcrR family transcriptional regulator